MKMGGVARLVGESEFGASIRSGHSDQLAVVITQMKEYQEEYADTEPVKALFLERYDLKAAIEKWVNVLTQ